MFNFFRKEPPKKANPMDQFKTEDTHKHVVIVFEQNETVKQEIREKAKNLNVTLCIPDLNQKTEARLKAMYDGTSEHGNNTYKFQSSALKPMIEIRDVQDQILAAIGQGHMLGYYICQDCLTRAIFSCEEQLQSLKDLQEATRNY